MTVAPEYSTDSGADRLWEGVQPEPARRLLVAGLGLFAAQGFHGTTTRDIAAHAGMSPAALYVHYRTKEDLLFRISRIAHEAALAAIPAEPPGSGDPAGQLQAAVAAFTAWHARHHTAARVAQYELAALEPAHFRAVAGERIAALGEAVEIMRILWRGGGSFGGRWYQLNDAPGYPGTARPGGPPVLIGGHGPHLLRAAARHADLCNVGFDLPVDSWRSLGPLLAGYLGEAGRSRESLGLTHNATVLLGADEAGVARQVSAWGGRRGLTEEAARGRLGHSLTGTPGQVSERLRALAAAGVGWVFLLFDALPRLAGLRSFAEAVTPALHSGRDEGTGLP